MAEFQSRKIIVFGIPFEANEETLVTHFSQFGQIDSTEVMKDKFTGRSRGFGFVVFSSEEGAKGALVSPTQSMDGREISVKAAVPREEFRSPKENKRIFVARIPPEFSEEIVRRYFEQFGEVTDCYMPYDPVNKHSRGIAFVAFAEASVCHTVVGREHVIEGKKVAVDSAAPKGERDRDRDLDRRGRGPPRGGHWDERDRDRGHRRDHRDEPYRRRDERDRSPPRWEDRGGYGPQRPRYDDYAPRDREPYYPPPPFPYPNYPMGPPRFDQYPPPQAYGYQGAYPAPRY